MTEPLQPVPDQPEVRMFGPSPTPMSWTLTTDQAGRIVVQVSSAAGIFVCFMDVEFAKELARMFNAEADKGPKLIVPSFDPSNLGGLRNGHQEN